MFFLLDNPNPNGVHYYTARQRCSHGLQGPHIIVLHTAENMPDFTPPDTGAESISSYASSTTRSVSWHSSVDSDSIIPMLPDTHVAWHVRNYNTCSLGIEMATQAHKWVDTPPAWRIAILENCARVVAEWSRDHNIPLTFINKSQVDAGGRGITFHSTLDPTRRTDPGSAFPLYYVLDFARRLDLPPVVSGHPVMGKWEASPQQALSFLLSRNPGYTPQILGKIVSETYRIAPAEGVRADIAIALMDKETGNFRYGGDVKPEQLNFGGIGATGGVPGLSFPTVTAGVHAVVRRMRMYAVHDRSYYNLSILGRALPETTSVPEGQPGFKGWGKHPNIEDFGGAWASPGVGYGESIMAIVALMKQEEVPGEEIPAIVPFTAEQVAWLDNRYSIK